MITLQLFLSFLQIGLFSFGGGYAAMPLLQEQLVARNGWLSVQEFADLVTIAEMTPGSDRGERGDLRRHEACWAPRCAASGKCFLGWGAGDACRDKLDDAAAFCRLLAAAAQNKAEPNSDNGTRGSHQCREICFGRIAGSGKSD